MAEGTPHRYAPDSLIGEVSAKELRTIIAAVTRGAALDAVRAQVIKRAEVLEVGGMLPDNWRADGTLASATATWATDEQRETWSDLRVGLQGALDEKFDSDDEWCYWIWVQDFTDTNVIFCKGDTVYSAPYSFVEGGPITIGDPVKVRPVTQYVPATTERAAGPLREWRQTKARSLGGLERRSFAIQDMELRENDDGTLHFSGYACVTGVAYDMGWYEETIERGAFKRTLGEDPDVQLLINHTGMPLARTRSGTLRLEERTTPDASGRTGLWVDADLDAEDPDVMSLRRKMARRDIDQMSFAFAPTSPGGWNEDFTERKISACTIHRGDVSIVNQGANPASTATLRSATAIASLQGAGSDAFVAALIEWRDHTSLALDERAGDPLSARAMDVISQISNLPATGDDAAGEARSLLAALMSVPPPGANAPPAGGAPAVLPDHSRRAREILASHRGGR